MSEQTPPEGSLSTPPPDDGETPAPGSESVTEGGYSYTVVDHEEGAGPTEPRRPRVTMPSARVPVLAAVVAVLLSAGIAAALVWSLRGSGDGGIGDGGRLAANVTNVVNAFSQGQSSTVTTRYEGEMAPGFPDSIPSYPGATLVSSELQISGSDAQYLVIYDTSDSRAQVTSYFNDKLSADPWQIEASQDGRDSSLRQFSKTDDANISGLVLAAESKQDNLTTVIYSVQVTSGATSIKKTPYSPGASLALPAGFPNEVPAYPASTVIQSAYQKSSGSLSFAVSLVTKDDVATVIAYYKQQLQTGGLTVTDGDASTSALANATAVQFNDSAQNVSGEIVAGTFPDDSGYTQVDIQASSKQQ